MTQSPSNNGASRREFLRGTSALALGGGFASAPSSSGAGPSVSETRYADRTDTIEEKLRLLETAHQNGRFELVQSLAESIKHTAALAKQQSELPEPPAVKADDYGRVEELPRPWRQWAQGWKFYKTLVLEETVGMARAGEPVDCAMSFRASQTTMLTREVRLAHLEERTGTLREVACQVSHELRHGEERRCCLTFLADSPAHMRGTYLVFYGNPDAELAEHLSDLNVSGEGYGLDIQNSYFKASLSRQMGQLERLEYRNGLVLFSGGEGHGEPPGIDWAHDYVTSGNFQKLRVTNWSSCANYEVIRGPVCVTVRRWGFPHSPVHPLFTPSRMHMTVEYRFFAGTPYFLKQSTLDVIKDLEITYMRDDEWVFSGFSFTDAVWMGGDGRLRIGAVDPAQRDNLWAVGFFHRENRNAFIGLHLIHEAEHFDQLKHSGEPQLDYLQQGQLWSRWPARDNARFSSGAVLRQKNAYLVLPFPEQGGPEMVEGWRQRLLHPLAPGAGELPRGIRPSDSPGRLPRPGEAGDSAISKKTIWDALMECKDDQLYRVDANVVDMGYVYDVRVRDNVIQVVMTMPHRGRPKYRFIGNRIRERLLRLPGVRDVIIDNTWDPAWTVNRLTDAGRAAMGL